MEQVKERTEERNYHQVLNVHLCVNVVLHVSHR